MMEIDKIKKLPSGKYKITFDNKDDMITYDDVIIKNKVLYNKEVSDDLFYQMHIDTKYFDLYNKVINYICRRIRSEKEINDFINKFDPPKEDKDKIIKILKNNGFINDLAFTKSYIADKIYLSNIGPLRIKDELLNYNVDESIIDVEIGKIDNELLEDKIKKMISKKIQTNHHYSNYILNQKIILELINLGFERDMIVKILESSKTTDKDILENEYNKIYNKLVKKYSGDKLMYQIKQKLYQKGFDIESINELIETKNSL